MAGLGSQRYDILRIGELIKNYVSQESASARATLSDMVLEGEDFIDALDNAKLELESESQAYDELEKKYKELEKNYEELSKGDSKYKKLVNNIESLIKGKEGPFIEKIKRLI